MAEHETVTPSGISIVFEDGEPDPATGREKWRSYHVNGQKLPSVTTVLGMLDKPGLVWWSEKLAVVGCIELAREGKLPIKPEAALGQLTNRGLRHFQVAEQKADRGKLSHEDLVHLAAGRELPALDTYPLDQQNFARGLAGLVADMRPTIHESEQMVASVEHGFAGRPDMVVTLGAEQLPNGAPLPRGRGLLDLKTHDKMPRTKPSATFPEGQLRTPYPEALLQVGLYEVGRRESGYEPTDWQGVIRVDANGFADFTCSWIVPEQTLALLPAFRLFKDVAQRVKTPAHHLPIGFPEEAAA